MQHLAWVPATYVWEWSWHSIFWELFCMAAHFGTLGIPLHPLHIWSCELLNLLIFDNLPLMIYIWLNTHICSRTLSYVFWYVPAAFVTQPLEPGGVISWYSNRWLVRWFRYWFLVVFWHGSTMGYTCIILFKDLSGFYQSELLVDDDDIFDSFCTSASWMQIYRISCLSSGTLSPSSYDIDGNQVFISTSSSSPYSRRRFNAEHKCAVGVIVGTGDSLTSKMGWCSGVCSSNIPLSDISPPDPSPIYASKRSKLEFICVIQKQECKMGSSSPSLLNLVVVGMASHALWFDNPQTKSCK